MNMTNVQDMVSMQGLVGSARSTGVTTSTQNASDNPFFQIFSNMVESAFSQNEDELTLNGNILSAQDLILMLMNNSGSGNNTSLEQSALNLTATPNELVLNFPEEISSQLLNTLLNVDNPTDKQSSFIDFLLSKGLTSENINQLNLGAVTNSNSNEGSDFVNYFSGESNFLKAVEISKKTLTGSESDMDIAAIIANLNGTAKTESSVVESLSENPMLTTQIESGVKENIKANVSEFTLKLYPESLGEITVKIINEDGIKSLEIIAASTKTALLINDEIPALKEALAGMQIEVKNAVEASSSSNSSNMQNFNFSSNEFSGRQWNFNENSQTAPNHIQSEITKEEPIQNTLHAPDSALNVYV